MCVVFTTGQLVRVATVTRTKNTGSYWREYTVKSILKAVVINGHSQQTTAFRR